MPISPEQIWEKIGVHFKGDNEAEARVRACKAGQNPFLLDKKVGNGGEITYVPKILENLEVVAPPAFCPVCGEGLQEGIDPDSATTKTCPNCLPKAVRITP